MLKTIFALLLVPKFGSQLMGLQISVTPRPLLLEMAGVRRLPIVSRLLRGNAALTLHGILQNEDLPSEP
ncbi:MAG: hypothetical protein ACXV7J_05050 [Methylomonas sp.]